MDGRSAETGKAQRWLQIDLVAHDLSEETGRSFFEVRRGIDKWFAKFVRQQSISENNQSEFDTWKLEVDLLSGYLRREILEIYCQANGFPEPSLWLADDANRRKRRVPVGKSAASKEPLADEVYNDPVVAASCETDMAPRWAADRAIPAIPRARDPVAAAPPVAAERPRAGAGRGPREPEGVATPSLPESPDLAADAKGGQGARFTPRGVAIKRAFLDASKRLEPGALPADAPPDDTQGPEWHAPLPILPYPPLARVPRRSRISRGLRGAAAAMAVLLLLFGGFLLWPEEPPRKGPETKTAARQSPARPQEDFALGAEEIRSAEKDAAISPPAGEAPSERENAPVQQSMAVPGALREIARNGPAPTIERQLAAQREPRSADRLTALAFGTVKPAALPAAEAAPRQAAAFDDGVAMGMEPVLRASAPAETPRPEEEQPKADAAAIQPVPEAASPTGRDEALDRPPAPAARLSREEVRNPIPEAPPAPKPYASLEAGPEPSDPRPSPEAVAVDDLVLDPQRFHGREVAVTGSLGHLLWRYRLMSDSEQNSLVVDIETLPAADRARLRGAIQAAGRLGTVRARAVGRVERDTVLTYRLVVSDVVLID